MLAVAIQNMLGFVRDTLNNNMIKYKPSTFYSNYISSTKIIRTGENGTGVRGTIMVKGTEQKINHAIVELVELGKFKVTDKTGNWSFKRLDIVECTIRVRAKNFDTMETVVRLDKGKLKEKVDFVLIPSEVPVAANA